MCQCHKVVKINYGAKIFELRQLPFSKLNRLTLIDDWERLFEEENLSLEKTCEFDTQIRSAIPYRKANRSPPAESDLKCRCLCFKSEK